MSNGTKGKLQENPVSSHDHRERRVNSLFATKRMCHRVEVGEVGAKEARADVERNVVLHDRVNASEASGRIP